MGQKVNPNLFRLGPVYGWSSRWYDEKQYKETLLEDYKLRNVLMKKLMKFFALLRSLGICIKLIKVKTIKLTKLVI